MKKLKYDNIRAYTSTRTYKISGGLLETFRRLGLIKDYRRAYKAGEYLALQMEKEIEDTLESNRGYEDLQLFGELSPNSKKI